MDVGPDQEESLPEFYGSRIEPSENHKAASPIQRPEGDGGFRLSSELAVAQQELARRHYANNTQLP